jgi:hypothetical protein
MSASTANLYLESMGIQFVRAPKKIKSKFGNLYSYSPLGTVTNGKDRPWSEYREDNDLSEYQLVAAACHVKRVLEWELHHLVAHSNGGSCNVSNLCLLPKGLNFAIGPNDWNLEQINEYISSLPEFARKDYGIPDGFRALPLQEGVEQAGKWLTPSLVEKFAALSAG